MENLALIESFSEFKDDKLIDRVTLMAILEEVFRSALRRKYGDDENFDVIINPDKGDLEIWRNRIVVEDGKVEDDNLEIELLKYFWQSALDSNISVPKSFEYFQKQYDYMSLQRHLKITGIFSRLKYRDHKPSYFEYIDKIYQSMIKISSKYSELKFFSCFLESLGVKGC